MKIIKNILKTYIATYYFLFKEQNCLTISKQINKKANVHVTYILIKQMSKSLGQDQAKEHLQGCFKICRLHKLLLLQSVTNGTQSIGATSEALTLKRSHGYIREMS